MTCAASNTTSTPRTVLRVAASNTAAKCASRLVRFDVSFALAIQRVCVVLCVCTFCVCVQTSKREKRALACKARAELAREVVKEPDLRDLAAAQVDAARSLQSARDRRAALDRLGQEKLQKPIRLRCIRPKRVRGRLILIRARDVRLAVPRISRKAERASARRAEAELEQELDAYSAAPRKERARACCAPPRVAATPCVRLPSFRSLVPRLTGSEKRAKEEACRQAIVFLTAAQRATRRATRRARSRGRLLLRNAFMTNICALMLEGNGLADSAAALVSQIQVRSASHQGELAEPGSCDPTGAVRHYRARTSVLESLLIPLVQGLEGRAAEVQKESGSDLDELQVSAEDAGSDDDSEADSYSEDFALEDSSEDSSESSEVNGAGSDVNADGDESEDSAGELWPRFSAGGPTVCAGCGAEDCDVCTQAKVVWRCMMKEADTLAETLVQDLDEGLAQCNGLRGGAKRKAPDPNNAPAATLRAAPAGAAAVAGVPAGAAVGAAASVAAAPEDAQPAPGIVLGLRPPDATSFSVSQAAQRRLLAAGTLGRFAVQQRLGFQRVQPTGFPADAAAVDIALEEPPAAVESAAVGPAAPAPAAADAPPPVVALVPFDIGVVEPMSAPQVQRLEREKMQKERERAREKERESEREREIREGGRE